ncbi:hypothetical protein [Streptomyces sp. NPDC006631]|uniref:hypothetical protein n=1 Tax=Streptomyces sp. NPDC006631 TaxID=3364752 RepID=UPI0036C09DE6
MSSKTTTTTVVLSEKDAEGNWTETSKSVTTVTTEWDDDGYPYGPIRAGLNPYNLTGRKTPYGDYIAWYDALNARPAKKKPEDGTGV